MKDKAVKKKWDTLVLLFYSQYRHIFEFNKHNFFLLLAFQDFANKTDLRSLKVLISDDFKQNPL